MKHKHPYVTGIVVGILLCIVIPLLVMALGIPNMGATKKPGFVERTVVPMAVNMSRKFRAPGQMDAYTNAPAVSTGLDHYRENCVMCHGAPGVEAGELARGLNPPAPKLESKDTQEMSDGQLFWTIKHGIRMSGMPAFAPTHTDEEIWKIVALLRHLPDLSPEEKSDLKAGGEHAEHHVAQTE